MYNYNDLSSCECTLLKENTKRLLSYDEVKDFVDSSLHCPTLCNATFCTSSLLLGNGFSIACNQNFDLSNLTQQMASNNPIVNAIFAYLKSGSWDIEETMRIINQSIDILSCCSRLNPTEFTNVINELQQFSQNLKNEFIAIIQTNHIPNIDDGAKMSAFDFINTYHCIFTLNYDLLLYWVTSLNWATFSDGFGRADDGLLIFNHNFGAKPFYFLHGALHLFYAKWNAIKLEHYDDNLLPQIKNKILLNEFPICVTAGTANEKLEMIKSNYYLNHCLNMLRSSNNHNLIVFGTYLKDNDAHIRDAILQSGVKNIFFGISSDSKRAEILQNFGNKGKNIFFYNYNNVDVWGNKNNTSNHNNAIRI